MNIGIIGSGNMGRAIGVRLAALGHSVLFGARDPAQAEAAARRASPGARAGSPDDAARFGPALVWTIRETDPARVLADPSLLDGRIVIDINNRDYAQEARTGGWFGQSIAEALQAAAPRSRVVKALNLVAMETLDTSPARLRDAGAQVFVAGEDAAAKATVTALVGELGFEAIDMGAGPAALRATEALGDVIRLLMIDGGRGGRINLQLRPLPAPDLCSIGPRASSSYR